MKSGGRFWGMRRGKKGRGMRLSERIKVFCLKFLKKLDKPVFF